MDQFRHLQPGDQLDGLPSPPWNHFLEATKARLGAKRSPLLETSVEFDVVNGTAAPINRFGILGVNAPLYAFAANPDNFFDSDTLRGIAPAAGQPFVVMQEPVSAGGVGRGRIQGITRVQLSVVDSTHKYAGPTTSTTELITMFRGPARIIKIEPGSAGSGSGSSTSAVRWAVVDLGGGADAPEETAYVRAIPGSVVAGRYPAIRMTQRGLPATWVPSELCWVFNVRSEALKVGELYPVRWDEDRFVGMKQGATRDCCPASGSLSGSGGCECPNSEGAWTPYLRICYVSGGGLFLPCGAFTLARDGGRMWGTVNCHGVGFSFNGWCSSLTGTSGAGLWWTLTTSEAGLNLSANYGFETPWERCDPFCWHADVSYTTAIGGSGVFRVYLLQDPNDTCVVNCGSGSGVEDTGQTIACPPYTVPTNVLMTWAVLGGACPIGSDGGTVLVQFTGCEPDAGGETCTWFGSGIQNGYAYYVLYQCIDGGATLQLVFPDLGLTYDGVSDQSAPNVWTWSFGGVSGVVPGCDLGLSGSFAF